MKLSNTLINPQTLHAAFYTNLMNSLQLETLKSAAGECAPYNEFTLQLDRCKSARCTSLMRASAPTRTLEALAVGGGTGKYDIICRKCRVNFANSFTYTILFPSFKISICLVVATAAAAVKLHPALLKR